MELVQIIDYGTCVSGGSSCYFWPTNITVSLGTAVMWFNRGSMLHTATACTSGAPTSGCPILDSASLPGFDSGFLAPKGSYKFTFTTPGTYYYYCTIHPWLHGSVTVVSSPPPPTPIASSFMPTISFAGSVNWTVNGLDNSVAVLNVSHQVSIIASVGPVSITPVTEKGSFSQSIDLATRIESAGTATSVLLSLAQRMLASLGSPGYYGGTGFSPALAQMLSDPKTVYTIWWVNGPLSDGQPVQILTGYSSVSGSEMVNLGPGNSRNAWIVASEFSQSLSTTTPSLYGPGGSSDSSFKLDLRFDYDQASDLLLKSSAVVSVTSAQTQSYKPGDYLCGPSGCFPVSDPVTVSHHMSATVPVTLQLASTNLDLSRRTPTGSIGNGQTSTGGPGGTSGTSTLPPAMSLLIYAGVGVVGAGIVGTLAWLLRRRSRIRVPLAQPGPLPDASPSLAGP
jgi:plastocyanin